MDGTEYCSECGRDVMPIDKRPYEFKCPTHGWAGTISPGLHITQSGESFYKAQDDPRTMDIAKEITRLQIRRDEIKRFL